MAEFRKREICLLDWAIQSCDLNPIENRWPLVKQKIKRNAVGSREEAIRSFIRVCNRDPDMLALCQKLTDSMPNRVNALLAANGGPTDY